MDYLGGLEMAVSHGKDDKSIPMKPQTLLTLMFVVALFVPASIRIDSFSDPFRSWHIITMLYDVQFSKLEVQSILAHPIMLLVAMLYFTLRLPFAYQIYRFYLGRTTRKRTLFLGIISELQHSLYWIGLYILNTIGIEWVTRFPSVYPIPILLILG
jgi:hypothetical protein